MKAALKLTASSLSLILVVTMSGQQPAWAEEPAGYEPPPVQVDDPVPGQDAPAGTGLAAPARTGEPLRAPAPVWPVAGVTEVDLAAAPATLTVGRLPVSVAPAGAAPDRVRVEVLDRGHRLASGVDGVVLRVSRADGRPERAPVDLSVDYDGFRHAYGADWASRLRLATLAAGVPRALPSRNDLAAGTVSAVMEVGAIPTTVVLAAGPAGAAGDYAATSLQPSSTWASGGNSGDFAWRYPMRVPPSLGGPAPTVGLAYSSQSVDGRMAASNNQPSWVGEGFEAWPGYIERRYKPCGEDMGSGATNTRKTGDLCWATDNAIMTLNGASSELLRDGDGDWHLRTEDGSRIERRTGGVSGDNNGEYWVVTAADGSQYWFGRNRLPGWTSGKADTNSVWTVPVFGNHDGEPCHVATFASAHCSQAWRWNLDYVVDPHGNTMTMWYERETNRYARNMTETTLAEYDRGGYLTRIDYGTRSDTAYGTAPMQVVYTPADRCLANCATRNATTWPDTPWDLACTAAPCWIGSPTFWSTKRLTRVTTKVGGANVESWTFTQSFPDPGDGTRPGLWLDRISHAGHVGGTTTVPDVTFAGTQLPNRVDAVDHSPAMNWWRLAHINTESGGSISVSYSAEDCSPGDVPSASALHANTRRCYPVRWTPEGNTTPVLDFFHRYVVTAVQEADMTGSSTRKLTTYEYVGAPAWRYTDDDGLVKAEYKTWSTWRGYAAVRTTVGDPGEQTRTETRYFRGMHGDRDASGTRTVNLPAAGGAPAVADQDAYAGMVRETIVYNGPGGSELSAEVTEPWQSEPTATRSLHGSTVHSRHVRVQADRGRGLTHNGTPRTTLARTTFDSEGMPIRVEDLGDTNVSGDEQCTITDHVRNTTAWLVSYPSRQREFATDCTRATGGGLVESDVLSDVRTSYDGQAFGAAPTEGQITRVETAKSWNPSTQTPGYVTTQASTYDDYSRVLTTTDVRGNITRLSYSPATGPVTSTVEENHLGWRTTTTVAPAWGQPTVEVDQNGRRTDMTYDGLGRLTGVWLPGRDKAGGETASMTFGYAVRTNAPTVVTTSRLNASGGYTTSHELYDGLLRPRQTQAPEGGTAGGRVISDTFYDSVGRVRKTYDSYVADGAPATSLFKPTGDNVVPAITRTDYDGGGRTVASVFLSNGVEKWRTTFVQQGDRVGAIAPAGGTTSQVLFDARGRTSQLREFPGGSLAGEADATTYTYDRLNRVTTVVDPTGNTWEYRYDLLGRQVWAKDPDRGVTTSVYNDAGDLLSTADARGVTLAYTYDSLGRRTTVREGSATGTKRQEWTYDTLAPVDGLDQPDPLGQLTRSTRWEGGNAYTTEVSGYTADYLPTGEVYTIPTSETGLAGSYTYTYTYRADGSPATTRLPDVDGSGGMPAETITHGYDAQGRAATLSTNHTSSGEDAFYINGTSYTRFGELAQLGYRFGTGKIANHTFYYQEGTRRLAQTLLTRETGPSLVADTRYSYDSAGNIRGISEQVAGDHQCFSYDPDRRLNAAWTPRNGDCAAAPSVAALGGPAPYWQSWTFDRIGNRTSQTDYTSTGNRTTNYTYPAAGAAQPHTLRSTSGAVTGSYTYDAVGNTLTRPAGGTTQTLTWDREGHLATVVNGTGTTSYLYDVDGERLVRRDPTGKTLYLPGQELRFTTSGAGKATTRYYGHAGQTVAMRTSAGVTWLFENHQDTATYAITESNQAVTTRRQTPYGMPRGSGGSWPNDRGFVGGTVDNTGLVHLGAREYDPAIGRFVSADPIIDHGDTEQVNGFAYANNTPVTMADPDGLFPCITCMVSMVMQIYSSVRRAASCRPTLAGSHCGGGGSRSGFGPRRVAKEVKRFVQGQLERPRKAIRSTGNKIKNHIRRKVNEAVWGDKASTGGINGANCVPRPLNGCNGQQAIERLWVDSVRHAHEHIKVSITVCDVVCGSLEYQGGTVSVTTGGGGMGAMLSASYNSLPANEQGPVGYGGCAARFVGGCTGATQRVDPNTGGWNDFGWSAGGAVGMGFEGFGPSYTVASYDTKTGKWTSPQPPPPFTPVTCPVFKIC